MVGYRSLLDFISKFDSFFWFTNLNRVAFLLLYLVDISCLVFSPTFSTESYQFRLLPNFSETHPTPALKKFAKNIVKRFAPKTSPPNLSRRFAAILCGLVLILPNVYSSILRQTQSVNATPYRLCIITSELPALNPIPSPSLLYTKPLGVLPHFWCSHLSSPWSACDEVQNVHYPSCRMASALNLRIGRTCEYSVVQTDFSRKVCYLQKARSLKNIDLTIVKAEKCQGKSAAALLPRRIQNIYCQEPLYQISHYTKRQSLANTNLHGVDLRNILHTKRRYLSQLHTNERKFDERRTPYPQISADAGGTCMFKFLCLIFGGVTSRSIVRHINISASVSQALSCVSSHVGATSRPCLCAFFYVKQQKSLPSREKVLTNLQPGAFDRKRLAYCTLLRNFNSPFFCKRDKNVKLLLNSCTPIDLFSHGRYRNFRCGFTAKNAHDFTGAAATQRRLCAANEQERKLQGRTAQQCGQQTLHQKPEHGVPPSCKKKAVYSLVPVGRTEDLWDLAQLALDCEFENAIADVNNSGGTRTCENNRNNLDTATCKLSGRKRVVVFGSTGSIGQSTLEVIEGYEHLFKVVGLAAAGSRLELLARQIGRHNPDYVVVHDAAAKAALEERLSHREHSGAEEQKAHGIWTGHNPQILTGDEGLVEVAGWEGYDVLVSGIVGFKGVLPTLRALTAGKDVALANKECLVAAGPVFQGLFAQAVPPCRCPSAAYTSEVPPPQRRAAYVQSFIERPATSTLPSAPSTVESRHISLSSPVSTLSSLSSSVCKPSKSKMGNLLPVDSEHSAIFQALQGTPPSNYPPQRLLLTASGGPFNGLKRKQLEQISVEDALQHPKWRMGKKISVDSATLMNKGLEVIEAHYAFGCTLDTIEVLIHPQAIVHSAVEFHDGAIVAQLGVPDMRLPIAYALTWPRRLKTPWPKLDLIKTRVLTFEEPDCETFGCLQLAYEAGEMGGIAPACLNGANEVAVERFLARDISFLQIEEVVRHVLRQPELHTSQRSNQFVSLDDVIAADNWARCLAREWTEK